MLQAQDVLSGKEGKAFIVIDKETKELAYLKNIEAKIEKNKAEVKALGNRGTLHKATGWNGTGSMTIYYMSSLFRKMMMEYVETGKDVYFDLLFINEDPASSTGKQTITLRHCNLDNVIMSKLDVDSDVLDESLDFTFSDVELTDKFNEQ